MKGPSSAESMGRIMASPTPTPPTLWLPHQDGPSPNQEVVTFTGQKGGGGELSEPTDHGLGDHGSLSFLSLSNTN